MRIIDRAEIGTDIKAVVDRPSVAGNDPPPWAKQIRSCGRRSNVPGKNERTYRP